MAKAYAKGIIREWYKPSERSFRMNESQDGVPEGMMRVTGVAAVIGVKNRNNRIYTEQNYLYWIDKLQPQIKAGKLFGELEHPESDNINNNNISHKIEALWYEPKTKKVMITLLLLDTEKGKIAQSRIKAGGDISVSSRANGSVNSQGIAVIDDLITYDIVGTPGFAESELYLSESLAKSNYARFKSSNTSECLMFVPQNVHNSVSLREALGSTYTNSLNIHNTMKNKKSLQESVRTAKRILESRKSVAGSKNAALSEAQAAQVQNWVLNECVPTLLKYMSKAGMIRINESMSKNLMSFADYSRKLMEAAAEKAATECNQTEEDENPENGERVLEPTDSLKGQVKAVTELKERWERKLSRINKKIREAEEEKADADDEKQEEIQETIDDLKKDRDDLEKKIDDLEKKIDEAEEADVDEDDDEKDAEKQELKESLSRKLRSTRRKLAEALEDKADALAEDDAEKAEEIQEDIDKLQNECDELKEEIDAVDEDDDELKDQTLSEDELNQLDDDELQRYIDANENAATDDEDPEEVNEDDDDAETPGAAEEAEDDVNEDDDETPAIEEEVESPFITEAKRTLRAQNKLVESLRARSKKKPLR